MEENKLRDLFFCVCKNIDLFFYENQRKVGTIMEKKIFSTRVLVYIAILGALSVLIMFFEFPVLPVAPFLKVDFQEHQIKHI